QPNQLGRAQAGPVEQLEQREQAQGLGPVAVGFGLGAGEQRLDFAVREDLRQRAPRRGARQRGCRIVSAQAFVDEKAVELAQRRALARDGRRRQRRPALAQPAERGAVGGLEIADQYLGALEVAAVGGESIGGSAPLGGEHGEEGVYGAGHQARATASAAIIRASALSPTRSRARTIWNRCRAVILSHPSPCMPRPASNATSAGLFSSAARSMRRLHGLTRSRLTSRSPARSFAAPASSRPSPASPATRKRDLRCSALSSSSMKASTDPRPTRPSRLGWASASSAQASLPSATTVPQRI